MGVTHYGNTGATLVWYPNQPTRERTGDVWGYVWRGWCNANLAHDGESGLIPASGTLMSVAPTTSTLPDAASMGLTNVRIAGNDAPERVDVELTYAYNVVAVPPWGAPEGTTERRCEVIMVDAPVAQVRDVDSPGIAQYGSEIANAGGQTAQVPGLRYTYAEYEDGFEWSEANLIAVSGVWIGEAGSPTGITSPTAGKWRLIGKHIEETGGGQAKVGEEWEYSPLGFPVPAP